MQNVGVGHLLKNEGQQRTKLDPEKLGRLAQQIMERGLDPDHPILVTQDDGEDYRIVRGHRRTMAYVIAHRAKETDTSPMDLAYKLATVEKSRYLCTECSEVFEEARDVCPKCGAETLVKETSEEISQERLAESFNKLMAYGDKQSYTIPVMVQAFEDPVDEQIALISDAFGAEDPDILGQAQAFQHAVQLGAGKMQIAQNTGLSTNEVVRLLAVAGAPKYVQEAVEDEILLPSHVAKIEMVNGHEKRAALYEMATRGVTHEKLDKWITRIQNWNPNAGETMLDMSPFERNEHRIESALYEQGGTDPKYWRGVATKTRELRMEAASVKSLPEAFPFVRCENCQLREVLKELPQNRFYPCTMRDDVEGCEGAVPEGDPWLLRSPYGKTTDMTMINGVPYFTSADDALDFLNKEEEEAPEVEEEPKEDNDRTLQLTYYMGTHVTYTGVEHPLATRCKECALKTADGCMMADYKRELDLKVLLPERDYIIPVCGHYMPTKSWHEMIPETKGDIPMTAEQTERVITMIAGELQMNNVHILPQITGTPVEGKRELFLEQFDREKAGLSKGRLLTLMKWVVGQWHLEQTGEFPLELPSGLEVTFTVEPYPRYDE